MIYGQPSGAAADLEAWEVLFTIQILPKKSPSLFLLPNHRVLAHVAPRTGSRRLRVRSLRDTPFHPLRQSQTRVMSLRGAGEGCGVHRWR